MRFHETVHGVYFDDLDAFQILHNARYVLLFERTIGSFWGEIGWEGPLDFVENPDQCHLVRANHVEYLKPVTGVGRVRVRAWVAKLGRTSLEFGLRCMPLNEDVDHAVGTRTIVRIDPETRRPVPWGDEFRKSIEPYRWDLAD